MRKFERFSSRAVILPRENIDTDQIIPARFLKVTTRAEIGRHLFANWRYDANGAPKPEFVLNSNAATDAAILIAGDNFGCGSSREHAVWALTDFGFRAVVSTRFADIFQQNALKNGLLPIMLNPGDHRALIALLSERPASQLTVDLENQTVTAGNLILPFPIDSFSKTCLLEGLDELGYLLKHEAAISTFEGG
jgi:3-isopropylmalate/(R)-2-methylmalate dehydratase small subunit